MFTFLTAIMDDSIQIDITEARLRDAACEAMRQLDDAEALLLFGSRARGTARPDSDWDVAVITREAARVDPDPPAAACLPK